MKTDKSLTVKQAGKKGGLTTKKKYGKAHYSKIGSIGGKSPKKKKI